MNTVKIKDVVLSNNPTAIVVDSPDGLNGKLNQTSKGEKRLYCVITLSDESNPFRIYNATRTYSQQPKSLKWRGQTPAQFSKLFKGKVIEGARFETHQVEPYTIEGSSQELTSYTTVVLPGENSSTVFSNAGHPIVKQTQVTETAPVLDMSSFAG